MLTQQGDEADRALRDPRRHGVGGGRWGDLGDLGPGAVVGSGRCSRGACYGHPPSHHPGTVAAAAASAVSLEALHELTPQHQREDEGGVDVPEEVRWPCTSHLADGWLEDRGQAVDRAVEVAADTGVSPTIFSAAKLAKGEATARRSDSS